MNLTKKDQLLLLIAGVTLALLWYIKSSSPLVVPTSAAATSITPTSSTDSTPVSGTLGLGGLSLTLPALTL